jgi:hypothetical protein
MFVAAMAGTLRDGPSLGRNRGRGDNVAYRLCGRAPNFSDMNQTPCRTLTEVFLCSPLGGYEVCELAEVLPIETARGVGMKNHTFCGLNARVWNFLGKDTNIFCGSSIAVEPLRVLDFNTITTHGARIHR